MQAATRRASSGAYASTSGRAILCRGAALSKASAPHTALNLRLRTSGFTRSFRGCPKVVTYQWRPPRFCRGFVNKHETETSTEDGIVEQRKRRPHGKCKPWPGFVSAAKHVQNDASILDERARNDLHLLQRGFVQLDTKARQDVALLGSTLHGQVALPLDSRAKADARRLRHIVLGLEASLAIAGKEHWSNGALDADLRLADLRARRRVMEDAYAAATSVKAIQEGLTRLIQAKKAAKNSSPQWPRPRNAGTRLSTAEQVAEVQAAYLELVGSLGQETTEGAEAAEDSEELELIVAALLDLDEVDGGNAALLVTEASHSPDAATRRALADALAAAPSLWALGNAGISALERLSSDRNKLVARAASSALAGLKDKWEGSASSGLLYLSLGTEGGTKSSDEDRGNASDNL